MACPAWSPLDTTITYETSDSSGMLIETAWWTLLPPDARPWRWWAAPEPRGGLRAREMFYNVSIMSPPSIGDFELAVLLCVQLLDDDAYGASVRRAVSERLGRDCSVGAVYTTLQRLEDKGLVRSWTSDPTPVRGGRARRCFAVTAAGSRAIRDAQATLRRLWSGHGLRWSDA